MLVNLQKRFSNDGVLTIYYQLRNFHRGNVRTIMNMFDYCYPVQDSTIMTVVDDKELLRYLSTLGIRYSAKLIKHTDSKEEYGSQWKKIGALNWVGPRRDVRESLLQLCFLAVMLEILETWSREETEELYHHCYESLRPDKRILRTWIMSWCWRKSIFDLSVREWAGKGVVCSVDRNGEWWKDSNPEYVHGTEVGKGSSNSSPKN